MNTITDKQYHMTMCSSCHKPIYEAKDGETYGGDFCSCTVPLYLYQACRSQIEQETRQACWEDIQKMLSWFGPTAQTELKAKWGVK